MTNKTCFIWQTPAVVLSNGNGEVVVSPRAGGEYQITGTAIATLGSKDAELRVVLTDWLVEQRRLGNNIPQITSYTIDEVKERRRRTVPERAESLLVFLKYATDHIGNYLKFDDSGEVINQLLAWTSSQTTSEIQFLAEYCSGKNWIDFRHKPPAASVFNQGIRLSPEGHIRLDEIGGRNTESNRAFVAMWFHDSMNQAFADGIQPAILDCGFECIRIDAVEHVDKIDDRIIAEIRRSRFVVADFTSEADKPRGGVYYEAGFAQGLGIPVIWTCRSDLIGQVHFDTRRFNHITWDDSTDLRTKLTNRVRAVIGEGPLKS